jgi:hypothetical protein
VPNGLAAGHSHSEDFHQRVQDYSGQSNAQKDDREGRQRLDQDSCEEKLTAPQNRQDQQRKPLASVHAAIDKGFGRHLNLLFLSLS